MKILAISLIIWGSVKVKICKNIFLKKNDLFEVTYAHPFWETLLKLVIMFVCCFYLTYMAWWPLIDNMIIKMKEEPIFYVGEATQITLTHEQKANRKLYNIVLEIEKGEEYFFEDVIGYEDMKIGDQIEVCFNPAARGIVSKVNGIEKGYYKYYFKDMGYPTMVDKILAYVSFCVYLVVQMRNYIKEKKEDKEKIRSKLFRYIWKYGEIVFSVLLILILFNVIDYYLLRNLLQCVYYAFVLGEFFYILDVGGFKWVTPKEEISISETETD